MELLLSRLCHFELKDNRDYGGWHHVPTRLAQTHFQKTARAMACAKLPTEQKYTPVPPALVTLRSFAQILKMP